MMQNLKKIESVLLFASILFLPTQLGKHYWPDFSFVFSLSIDYLSPVIYFWDILILLLISIFLLQGKQFAKVPLNIFLFFLLFQLTALMSALFFSPNLNLGASLVRLEQYFIAGIFGLYIASVGIKGKERLYFWSISLAIIFEFLLGASQVLYAKTIGFWILGERSFSIATPAIAKFDFYGYQFLRPYGTMPHPNLFAAFFIIYLMLLLCVKKEILNVKNFEKFFFSIAVILSNLAVLVSVSRVAILTLFSETLLFSKVNKKYLLIIIIFLSPFLYTRYSSILTHDNLSLVRREDLIKTSAEIFSKFPFSGIGLNNFVPFLSSDYIAGPSRFLQPVHNIYLLILSETGLIGFMGWVILLGYPIYKKSKLKIQSAKFGSIWIAIFFLGLFDHYFLTLPQGYRMIFLIWGLTVAKT